MPLIQIKVPGGNELIDPKALLTKAGIVSGLKVADLGCGAKAYFALQAGKMVGKEGMIYVVDIRKPVLENAVKEFRLAGLNNFKPVWSDLEIYGATKIPAESVDVVLLINILFQTKKDESVIKEAIRLLKSGGKLLIVDWKMTGAPFGPAIEDRLDPDLVKQWAVALGLNLEKEFEAGPYHYALLFKK